MGQSFHRMQPTVRIYCKAGHKLSLTIRGGKVVLAPANPADEYQHWFMDKSFKDQKAFALVNKKTGEIIKRASSNRGPVQLIPFNVKIFDAMSVLWTKDGDLDAGDYKAIRAANLDSAVLNASGDYAHDGTNIIVCSWANGKDNEVWKIEPYSTVKIYCKAGPDFNITIRDGKLVLAKSNPSDELQHWYRDDMYNFRKDDEGNPSFVLINKVTGQAMRHSVGSHQHVQLDLYNPVTVEESVLWTESKDLGAGYKTIKKFTDSRLIVNASGGITNDGASIILHPWVNGADNQQWKMESVRKPTTFVTPETTIKLYCKAGPNLSVTIRDGKVVLAPSNPTDEFQHWYKKNKFIINKNNVENEDFPNNADDEDFPFALVNKKTGQAIKHAVESHKPVQLIPYNPNVLNEFVLWTQGKDLGDGYKPIREANNTHLNFNARGSYVDDGTSIIVFPSADCSANEVWRIEPYSTVKVFCKIQPFSNIAVVNGKVGLVESNPSDEFQHWYKDERYGTTKDDEGYPAFALINKATGHALKHSTRSHQPLQLVRYKPTAVDESILWTEGKDLGDGYKAIRMANNIHLNIRLNQKFLSKGGTIARTDPNDPVILSPWNNGADNEMWKIKTFSMDEIPEISCSLL